MNSLGKKSFFSSVECCKARNITQGNFMTWNITDFKGKLTMGTCLKISGILTTS